MKFKKLKTLVRLVKTSNKELQQDNFEIGLVEFFNNFCILYFLLSEIEDTVKGYDEMIVLPSFNFQSDNKDEKEFKLLRIQLQKNVPSELIKVLLENYTSISYKGNTYSFSYKVIKNIIEITLL